jgi:hypothetical protein
MFLLSWGAMIGGGLLFAAGFETRKTDEDTGNGMLGGGVVIFILGLFFRWLFEGSYSPLMAAAESSSGACFTLAYRKVILSLFIDHKVYLWSWSVFAATLTAAGLTGLVLGALRLESAVKYAMLKIGYRCPVCHSCRVPHFRCHKCSALITDLRPTIYGIFQAQCGNCRAIVSTTDLGGRLRLEKVCSSPGCSHDLTDKALGTMSEFGIAVVGATSSGKTALMLSSVWQFEEDFAPGQRLKVDFANPSEERNYRQAVQELRKGRVPPKTGVMAVPRAFNLSLQPRSGRGALLYLYDAAGEAFEEGAAGLAGHSFHRRIDGVIFVLDPFAEQEWRRRLPAAARGQVNPAAVEATEILGQLLPHWERCLHIPSHGRFPFPLALVVTKMDACGLEKVLGGREELVGFRGPVSDAAERAVRGSDELRQFLLAAGLGNLLRMLEERFADVAYFGATALGRLPDPKDASPFRPRGVLAPLVWLCDKAHALTDTPGLLQAGRHVWSFIRRCLRGAEGGWARAGAWATLTVGITAAGFVLWLIGGLSLCVATAVLLFGLAAVLTYRLTRRARRDQKA